jgi:hypothetical protein
MNEAQLSLLIQKMATAVERFSRDCERIRQDMHQFTERAPGMVRQTMETQLHDVADNAMKSVQRSVQQSMANHEQKLRQAGDQAQGAAQALAAQFNRVGSLQRRLIWMMAGVVLTALALTLGGAIWLSTYYMGVIRDNQLSAALLKAYNGADVTLCEGRLCARVGKKYVPVEPR